MTQLLVVDLNLEYNIHPVCLYQTAKLEQSRRMRSVIIEGGCVSMGTGAPFPPEVFVVVNGMKTLVTANSSVIQSCLSGGHGFDEEHLVTETQKPPGVQVKNFRVDFFSKFRSPTDLRISYDDRSIKTRAQLSIPLTDSAQIS